MSAIPKSSLTPEQYFERERRAEFRSEFYRGEMFAMAGGSPRHSRIKTNLLTELQNSLKGRICVPYDSDLRILIPATGLYTYPDASVICGALQFSDAQHDTVTNPTLLAEVLSATTEAYDRGTKFSHYRQLASLKEYLLVSQDSPRLECFARNPDGTWTLTVVTGLDASLALASIGAKLSLAEIYDRVDFTLDETNRPPPAA